MEYPVSIGLPIYPEIIETFQKTQEGITNDRKETAGKMCKFTSIKINGQNVVALEHEY